MINILEWVNQIAEKYGFFVVGGTTGAVIHRLRHKMSLRRFLSSICISMFVSLCVGVIAKDYFQLKESIVYVLCGISGVFSNTILDEIEEVLNLLSDYVKNKMGGFDNETKHIPNEGEPNIPPFK